MNFLPSGGGSLLTEISLRHTLFNLLSVSVALYSVVTCSQEHTHTHTHTETHTLAEIHTQTRDKYTL